MAGLLKPTDLKKIADDLDMEKAKKQLEHMKAEEDEQSKLRETFMGRDIHPEVADRVNAAIKRAAEQGNRQVLIMKFPANYCNDHGRKINNMESDWSTTLEGFAKKAYEYYDKEMRSLGFKLTAQVLDYPGGMPGNIGLYLGWDR